MRRRPPPAGSCIVVVLTDGAGRPAGCVRLARRAGLGLARTGSAATHGSGEIFLAAATGLRAPRGQAPAAGTPVERGGARPLLRRPSWTRPRAAVLNSLLQAPTVTGHQGHTSPGLPADAGRATARRRSRAVADGHRDCDQWLTMADGVRLSATLYLPGRAGPDAADPVPARGVALPQGRPHLVVPAGVRRAARHLRVRRVPGLDVRGTGSSAGDVVDEYPPQEQEDLAEVIAWLAEQPWCSGAVGHVRHVVQRVQLAADGRRAPPGPEGGLRDLRLGRPVHRRRALHRRPAEVARPGRLLPLHDADERAPADARGMG